MEFVSKQLRMEAVKVVNVFCSDTMTEGEWRLKCENGGTYLHKGINVPVIGDYVNITNPDDIYHMPQHIIEGPNAKYVPRTEEKTLNVSEVNGARKVIKDIEIVGNGDMFQLMCKASSKSQGWMKSCKAMETPFGCVVQVTTQQGSNVAEALTFVPNVELAADVNNGRKLVTKTN